MLAGITQLYKKRLLLIAEAKILNKSIFINKFHLPNSRSTFGFFVSFVDSTRDDSRKIILLYKMHWLNKKVPRYAVVMAGMKV